MTQQAPTSLSEEERLLIDGHMIALLVTAFHDDGMDGRRVQRLALLAVKALRPIIDRLTSAKEGWRSIETAPKDGTEIWVTGGTWLDDAGGGFGADGPLDYVATAHWKRDGWCMGYTGDGYNAELWAHPTHWQPMNKPAPIPAPPEERV